MREGFNAVAGHVQEEIGEEDHKADILRMFERKRPENLLLFQKAFLQMNTAYNYRDKCQSEARMCSSTLAKYVLEKWKNVMPVMRELRRERAKADRFYKENVLP